MRLNTRTIIVVALFLGGCSSQPASPEQRDVPAVVAAETPEQINARIEAGYRQQRQQRYKTEAAESIANFRVSGELNQLPSATRTIRRSNSSSRIRGTATTRSTRSIGTTPTLPGSMMSPFDSNVVSRTTCSYMAATSTRPSTATSRKPLAISTVWRRRSTPSRS